jgi:hypothetical protein
MLKIIFPFLTSLLPVAFLGNCILFQHLIKIMVYYGFLAVPLDGAVKCCKKFWTYFLVNALNSSGEITSNKLSLAQ